MMNYEIFCEEMADAVRMELPGINVRLREVEKNNRTLMGVVMSAPDEVIAPTVYLEECYERYKGGDEFQYMASEIAEMYRENRSNASAASMDFYKNYDSVKNRLYVKLVNYEANKGRLEGVPHERYLDLAVTAYYDFCDSAIGRGTIQVQMPHLKRWGITETKLLETAKANTDSVDANINGMDKVLRDLMDRCYIEQGIAPNDLELDGIMGGMLSLLPGPMYIMDLGGVKFGAASMLFQDKLDDAARECKGSFYLLPSSVHEVLIVPSGVINDSDALKTLVEQVNGSAVSPEDKLSDSVYYYDATKREMRIV